MCVDPKNGFIALPVEPVAGAEDPVDFNRQWEQERALSDAAAALSVLTFAAVWSNPEDGVYDSVCV
jgi:hypothetical protein